MGHVRKWSYFVLETVILFPVAVLEKEFAVHLQPSAEILVAMSLSYSLTLSPHHLVKK